MLGAIAGGILSAALTRDENAKNRKAAAEAAVPQYNPLVAAELPKALSTVRRDNAPVAGVAGFTGNQEAGLSLIPGIAEAQQQQQGTVADAFQKFAGGEMVNANPFLDQAIAATADNAVTNFQRSVLPSIRNTAVMTGGIGGSRQGIAEGLAMSDLNRQLLDMEMNARSNQFNTDIGNQLGVLQNQAGILSGQRAPSDTLLAGGGIEQAQQQRVLDAKTTAEQENYNRDQEFLRLLLGAPAGQATVPNQVSPLSAGVGTALTLNQLLPNQSTTPTYVNPTFSSTNSGAPGFRQ